MKKGLFLLAFNFLCLCAFAQTNTPDTYQTTKGPLTIHFIGHGTLQFDFNGTIVHVDPWSRLTDYSKSPKADIILITHEHPDHLDSLAIRKIEKAGTSLLLNAASAKILGRGDVLKNGDVRTLKDITVEAVPAYNVSPGREKLHPMENGNGYMLTFANLKVYVAGDTELIPEMSGFANPDIAFLPVNQPYTMLPEHFYEAACVLKPKFLYPYHYGETPMSEVQKFFKGNTTTTLIVKSMR